jgi:hypothetical protein
VGISLSGGGRIKLLDFERRISRLEAEVARYARRAIFDREAGEVVAVRPIPPHRRTFYYAPALVSAGSSPIDLKIFRAYTIIYPSAAAGTVLFNIHGTGYYDMNYRIIFHSFFLGALQAGVKHAESDTPRLKSGACR